MKLLKPSMLLVVVVLGVAVAMGYRQLSAPASVSNAESALAWQAGYRSAECWFDVPVDRIIECGYLSTPADSGKFRLPAVIFRDQSADHRPDPVVYLSGGPGNSSFLEPENIDDWYYWLDTAELSRDLVLLDQRGTGLSEPRWGCENYNRFVREVLRVNLSLEQEYQRAYDTIHQCLQEVRRQGFKQSDYSTTHSAADLSQLMRALGYEQWNVMGVSYGTRLALEWLRRDGTSIRSLILDSVYPLNKGLLNERPELLHRSLQNLWANCARGDICNDPQLLGDTQHIEQRFWQAMDRLAANPITLSASNWQGDWPVRVVLNDQRFLSVVYSAQYDSYLHSVIIDAINEINGEQRGQEALEQVVEHSVNGELSSEFNTLVYLAIECGETPPINEQEYNQTSAKYPKLQQYTRFDWRYDVCKDFSARKDLQEFHRVFAFDTPTLMLAGELDPVTPVTWARQLQQQARNSQLLVMPSLGHGVTASSECIHTLLHTFLDAPNVTLKQRCDDVD